MSINPIFIILSYLYLILYSNLISTISYYNFIKGVLSYMSVRFMMRT